MLGGGEHGGRIIQTFALVAADERGAKLTDEVGIFAECFAGASPAQIAGQTKYWREGPMDTGGRHFFGGYAPHLLDQLGIPTRGKRELSRKDGRAFPERVSVDAVLADQQRDPEAFLRR